MSSQGYFTIGQRLKLTKRPHLLELTVSAYSCGDFKKLYDHINTEFDWEVLGEKFATIVDMKGFIDQHALFTPADQEWVAKIIDLMNRKGRRMAVWIPDTPSLQQEVLHKLAQDMSFSTIFKAPDYESALAIVLDNQHLLHGE